MKSELFFQSEDILGEGPVWDHLHKELIWVDIEKGLLQFFSVETNKRISYPFDSRLGAAVPTDREDIYLLALQKGLAFFNRKTGELNYFSHIEIDRPDNRFNDGKCDTLGRFWIGTMDVAARKSMGSLYLVDRELKISRKLSKVTISNGMAWSADGKSMFYIDTATHSVLRFDYENETGGITNPKVVIRVPESHGAPDGMCIDLEGKLWIAHWGGANISRWDPENGALMSKIHIPALQVTSCCFGGEDLDTLFITSARINMSAIDLEKFPLSGSVFSLKVQVGGLKVNCFKSLSTNYYK